MVSLIPLLYSFTCYHLTIAVLYYIINKNNVNKINLLLSMRYNLFIGTDTRCQQLHRPLGEGGGGNG